MMSWQHLLPPLHLSYMFASEFFPKWLGVLTQWLASPSADFGEISEWYSGWKSMFQQTALEKDEAILGYFNLALEMMQSVLTYDADDNLDGNAQGGPLAQFQDVLQALSGNKYLKQLESRKQEIRVKQTRQQHQQAVKNAKHTASLSDLVLGGLCRAAQCGVHSQSRQAVGRQAALAVRAVCVCAIWATM
mmetsp:Transcript_31079/g.42493  ORF Transcript_31079/g.42493 Transcript_31079/m.42493 type:complete len:190 (-) Transcript_31079:206-775(-)